jgi:hypothetical protein
MRWLCLNEPLSKDTYDDVQHNQTLFGFTLRNFCCDQRC